VMPALEAFHRIHGHCRVPFMFDVPSDESWPTPSWGLKLGNFVAGILSRDKARLVALGFVWNFFEAERSERIMPALETFHRINGYCRVPRAFVVPSNESWPTLSWGLKLGSGIRSQGYYSAQVGRDKDLLEEMGFELNVYEADWSTRILPALEAFYRIKGHSRVPQGFVVPSESSWPIEVQGLRLGSAVHNIRSSGSYF
ncbi:hypothetical protein PHYSODRAFT_385031, partial [Phytophthora sojae]